MIVTPSNNRVYTIGHSTHPIERFIELLQQHDITTVADVRSTPFSRFQPQFGRDILTKLLRDRGIKYVFLGEELGGRGNDKSSYESGRVQYRRLAETPSFRTGLERVRSGSVTHRIALMCAEGEPLACHRSILIGRELEAAGIRVAHIHPDGHLESHEEAILRLLQELDMAEPDLFRTQEQRIEEAYAKQEERIAYVDSPAEIQAETSFA
jgi:uncharacterized protein (DUF488 family)